MSAPSPNLIALLEKQGLITRFKCVSAPHIKSSFVAGWLKRVTGRSFTVGAVSHARERYSCQAAQGGARPGKKGKASPLYIRHGRACQ